MITAELIRAVAPECPERRAVLVAPALWSAARQQGITTAARVAAFVSQLAHESAGFRHWEEVWGPTRAQRRYEGRRDLGNIQRGDGYRFRGRGPIQITGRANYERYRLRVRNRFGLDILQSPDVAADLEVGAYIAACYWVDHGLNDYADRGDFRTVTRKINGGFNGWGDRLKRYRRAKNFLHRQHQVVPRVFLRDSRGKNVLWDGNRTVYGGVVVSGYPDGALQLEREEQE